MNKTYNNNPKQAGNDMNSDKTNRLVCSSLVARLLKNPARQLRTFSLKSYLTFLSRNKAYTAVNIFGLAVSLTFVIIIGLYTWQEYNVNRQHSNAGRIYNVGLELSTDSSRSAGCHHAVLRLMQKRYPEIEETCGFITGGLRLKNGDDFMNIITLETDSTFFGMFDFPLLRGNRATCLAEKGNMVVTEKFARRFFGTDDVIGRSVMTDNSLRFRITGVMKDFTNTIINDNVDALIDFSYTQYDNAVNSDQAFPNACNPRGCSCFVRVRKGSDFTAKEGDLRELFATFWPEYKGIGFIPFLTPLDKLYFAKVQQSKNLRHGNTGFVNILLAIGIVILLFSIMNYINLTVAQTGYRAREMATRRLFGCLKTDVGLNMFTESLVMCATACAIAVALAVAVAPRAGRLLDADIDVSLLTRPEAAALIAALVITVSMFAGMLPALILSKVQPVEVVRGTFRKQTKMVFSRVFITVQNVITITLLACALIMSLQMLYMVKAPMGFNTTKLIYFADMSALMSDKFPSFADKLHTIPSVKGFSVSFGTPVEGGIYTDVTPDNGKSKQNLQYFVADTMFMKVYGIKLKTDRHVKGDNTVYLNNAAMKLFHMNTGDTHTSAAFRENNFSFAPDNAQFGGVFENFRTRTILENDLPKVIFVCRDVKQKAYLTIMVDGDMTDTYSQIKKLYKNIYHEDMDESQPGFVDKMIEFRFKEEIRTTKIVSLFAFVAIVISLLGLVAMSTYFIQQRAREIAVRKVFGSTDSQIQRRLIRSFLAYVGIAFVMAVPVTVHFMSNWIAQYSYRIVWWPWIIASGVIVLLISFAAVAVQSSVAARENPVKNIKQE